MPVAQTVLAHHLRLNGWLTDGREYETPLRPDRVIWIAPERIHHKPHEKPRSRRIPPTLVVGGDWDRTLIPIEDDIVWHCFRRRFQDGESWEQTGYIDYLTTDDSEHGGCTRADARTRCEHLDRLYQYIEEHGYRSQKALEQTGGLIDELTATWRPPAYREIAVDVTRHGEFVWHAGMHRLVMAKLLDVSQIPVRVNIRHRQWQRLREAIYTGEAIPWFEDHPDIEYLLTDGPHADG